MNLSKKVTKTNKNMNFRINFCVQVILVFIIVTFDHVSSYDKRNGLFIKQYLDARNAEKARDEAKVTHGDLAGIESYAGYFSIDAYQAHLFFWYFPATEVNTLKAPVVLFLEGTPQKNIFFSVFVQNGPLSMSSNGSLVRRKESWNKNFNMLYIDSLCGLGYSYTDSYSRQSRENIVGYQVHQALQQFLKLFPDLRRRDFFVAGSYQASGSALEVAKQINWLNPRMDSREIINLKGIAIANGWIDPANQLVFGEYLNSVGLIDANERDQFLREEKKIRDLILARRSVEASNAFQNLMIGSGSLFNRLTGYLNPFNILKSGESLETVNSNINKWVTRQDVRNALHVGNRPYKPSNELVMNDFKQDIYTSKYSPIPKLLKNYRILIYTGNLDIMCSYPSIQNFLQELNWTNREYFKVVKRIKWRVAGDRIIAGYIKKAYGLTEVLMRNAGHYTSVDQPQWTRELMEKFVNGTL